jgi:hypothetical protein
VDYAAPAMINNLAGLLWIKLGERVQRTQLGKRDMIKDLLEQLYFVAHGMDSTMLMKQSFKQ